MSIVHPQPGVRSLPWHALQRRLALADRVHAAGGASPLAGASAADPPSWLARAQRGAPCASGALASRLGR